MKNLNYKTMRKIVFALLMLLTLSMKAQNDGVIKFLGIPVDGTKSEMISKLTQKGFIYDSENDFLDGVFNGGQVHIYVHSNNNKVDRIMVASQNQFNESEIITQYNNLLYDFVNNDKYVPSLSYEVEYINTRENISYEMTVNHKSYDAAFIQVSNKSEIVSSIKEILDNYESVYNYLKSESSEEAFAFLDEENRSKEDKAKCLAYLFNIPSLNNMVWFNINEFYGKYYITIYYDNLSNRPNGEDL